MMPIDCIVSLSCPGKAPFSFLKYDVTVLQLYTFSLHIQFPSNPLNYRDYACIVIECTGVPEDFAADIVEHLHISHLSLWCSYDKSQFLKGLTEHKRTLPQSMKEVSLKCFVVFSSVVLIASIFFNCSALIGLTIEKMCWQVCSSME